MPGPTGVRLTDGFASLITFSQDSTIELWEQDMTAPGVDMGGPINTTTMRNLAWMTFAPKKLATLTPVTFTAQFDPKVFPSVMNQKGNNQSLTVKFSNGATLTFWGFLDKFLPQRFRIGEPCLADVTMQPTNQDNSGVEQAPTYTAPSSTTASSTTTLV